MKTIGVLGGMSWESSAIYYRLLNEMVRARCGGLHSADMLLRSLDFATIEAMQERGDWTAAGELLAREAKGLVAGGAELLVLATNTMHMVADAITDAVDVPFIHIADATATALKQAGISTLCLLGTAHTMERDFYVGRLEKSYGLSVIVPNAEDRFTVHRIIYEELCLGIATERSRTEYRRIIHAGVAQGAQAVVLGCTEIGLLIQQDHIDVPVFDTTTLHAQSAIEAAFG